MKMLWIELEIMYFCSIKNKIKNYGNKYAIPP
jgi:hypothetical protein